MSSYYFYLRYDKTKGRKIEPFINFLKCVNPDKLALNENCRVVYDEVPIDFFILDEFVTGISNKIYKIGYYKFDYIGDDNNDDTENLYPKIKSTGGRLFYRSFENRFRSYFFFIEKFTVEKHEYRDFAEMILTIQKRISELSLNDYDTIAKVFIETGDVRLLFNDCLIKSLDSCCSEYAKKNLYYPCPDQDALFYFLMENSKSAFDGIQTIYYYADLNMSSKNFSLLCKFRQKAARIHPVELFYQKRIFGSGSGDPVSESEIKEIEFGPIKNYLFTKLINRIKQDNYEISDRYIFKFLDDTYLPKNLRMLFFKLTLEGKLRRERDFNVFVRYFSDFKWSVFLNEIFDIFVDNFEIESEQYLMKNINVDGLTKIFNSGISGERRDIVKLIFDHSSKVPREEEL